jgi:hypothetical protein
MIIERNREQIIIIITCDVRSGLLPALRGNTRPDKKQQTPGRMDHRTYLNNFGSAEIGRDRTNPGDNIIKI